MIKTQHHHYLLWLAARQSTGDFATGHEQIELIQKIKDLIEGDPILGLLQHLQYQNVVTGQKEGEIMFLKRLALEMVPVGTRVPSVFIPKGLPPKQDNYQFIVSTTRTYEESGGLKIVHDTRFFERHRTRNVTFWERTE